MAPWLSGSSRPWSSRIKAATAAASSLPSARLASAPSSCSAQASTLRKLLRPAGPWATSTWRLSKRSATACASSTSTSPSSNRASRARRKACMSPLPAAWRKLPPTQADKPNAITVAQPHRLRCHSFIWCRSTMGRRCEHAQQAVAATGADAYSVNCQIGGWAWRCLFFFLPAPGVGSKRKSNAKAPPFGPGIGPSACVGVDLNSQLSAQLEVVVAYRVHHQLLQALLRRQIARQLRLGRDDFLGDFEVARQHQSGA